MKDLPNWVKKILDNDKLTCGACDKLVTFKNLFSVGIQKSNKKPYKEVLSIGLVCKYCNEMTIFELNEMTLLDLAFEVLEEQSKTQDSQNKEDLDKEMGTASKKSKKVKSKITIREIKDSVAFLNELETHDDFLMALGMSLEEIESYKIKKHNRKPK